MPTENLFLNTLAFKFPKDPVTFYFSLTDRKNVNLTKLNHQLFPSRVKEIFPDINNRQTLYTSFTRPIDGFKPLPIDFADDNFALVKRYYNREIKHYFTRQNILVEPNFVNDNQIWLRATDSPDNKIKGCTVFDRFTLKVNFNHFSGNPEIVLSYDRQAKILNKSVAAFLSEYEAANDDIFSESQSSSVNPAGFINRVLYIQYFSDDKKQRKQQILKYKKLCDLSNDGRLVDYNNVYPIVQNSLASYLGLSDEQEEEHPNTRIKKNRYTKYISKIIEFKNRFISTEEFKKIIPVVDHFTPVQAGKTNEESKRLVFGKKPNSNENLIDVIPQWGINAGPYSQPRHNNIQLFFIVSAAHKKHTIPLLDMLRNGYYNFKGLSKYLGIQFTTAPGFSIVFADSNNPIPEIEEKLMSRSFDPGTKYFAIYLTPISKYAPQKEQRIIYYRIKELLLKWNITSQCIETDKMLRMLEDDRKAAEQNQMYPQAKYKKHEGNFAYTLQNIAIAINAKLGGTPWRIAVPKYRELIVGVGAFKHNDTNTQYIGSAFSFDNTGAFNSFEYFQKDEIKELAGSIKDAIIQYKNAIQNPNRLIIHYYKEMREDQVEIIEDTLPKLNLDIPIFVVTINKTEAEDIIVFDDDFAEKMPYSGRYINLGNNTFLLCNNTRYEVDKSQRIESYPFPVKLKIKCPTDSTLLNQNTIQGLIDQVYQFSRIYWKSVKQQNLPVTIKYPEMVASMAPYFSNGSIPIGIGKDNLWFL